MTISNFQTDEEEWPRHIKLGHKGQVESGKQTETRVIKLVYDFMRCFSIFYYMAIGYLFSHSFRNCNSLSNVIWRVICISWNPECQEGFLRSLSIQLTFARTSDPFPIASI